MNNIVLILSDARGIYIPRDFLTDNYNEIAEAHCAAWGLTEANKEQWQDASDPENPFYWDAWDWILNNARFTAEDGRVFSLHHDGDLYGIAYDSMAEEERLAFFGE